MRTFPGNQQKVQLTIPDPGEKEGVGMKKSIESSGGFWEVIKLPFREQKTKRIKSTFLRRREIRTWTRSVRRRVLAPSNSEKATIFWSEERPKKNGIGICER